MMQTGLLCLAMADKEARKTGPCVAGERTDQTRCVYFGTLRLIHCSFREDWHW